MLEYCSGILRITSVAFYDLYKEHFRINEGSYPNVTKRYEMFTGNIELLQGLLNGVWE